MFFNSRKEKLFILLGGFFITNAILGEVIGGKLLSIGPFTMSMGILPWPIVFLMTDIINEFFGKEGVKKLTWLTTGLIAYLFVMLFIGQRLNASPISPISNEQFSAVFGQTSWLIIASLIAFLASQFIDVTIFWLLREKTGRKMIWLRSTGSTVISQLVDTFIVAGIGFYLPGKLNFNDFINTASTGYAFKLIIAVSLTPFIYLGHHIINKYLGNQSDDLIQESAAESLGKP